MQIKHVGTIFRPAASTATSAPQSKGAVSGLQPCVATAFSPDGCKFAAAMAYNIVYLFDDIGQRKDRFATKAGDPKVCPFCFFLVSALYDHLYHNTPRKAAYSAGPPYQSTASYGIQGLVFSPDSTRLAVVQTDQVIFVYRLGLAWGEKKSICNKFVCANVQIVQLSWPSWLGSEQLLFATADHKVPSWRPQRTYLSCLYG